MAKNRLLTEFGMGSSLRRQDYTQAAKRAVENALWHNSINLAELLDRGKEDMLIDVEVGVQAPEQLNTGAIAEIFPYGQVNVIPRKGGLDGPRGDGGLPTVIANVAISVSFEMGEA